jgi:DNA anti-recombination protein RmuC
MCHSSLTHTVAFSELNLEANEPSALYIWVESDYTGGVDMKELAEILEDELAEAVEVKNRKSLHRYVMLLTGQHVDQESYDQAIGGLRSSIDKTVEAMTEGFKRMDERFTQMQKQMDERFTQMQKQMDERFTQMQKQMDERFTQMQKQMDERFEAHERRFEDMNKRFDHMNERFNSMQRLIGMGFAAMAFIVAAFNLALLLG